MKHYLTIYNNADQIEREIIQLVYYGHLSYIDCQYMSYHDRQFWLKELEKIIRTENSVNDSSNTVLSSEMIN